MKGNTKLLKKNEAALICLSRFRALESDLEGWPITLIRPSRRSETQILWGIGSDGWHRKEGDCYKIKYNIDLRLANLIRLIKYIRIL